jgi:gamma-glutamyltranspeptidase/glutathione hydrolase
MKTPVASLLWCLALLGCSSPPAGSPASAVNDAVPHQPEGSSQITEKSGWTSRTYAVAAANPLASEAGRQVLAAGGSAVDAAIAVQMVLTLVEPQSSGIGGGAFMLHFDGQRTQAFDGRETAPAGARPELFLGADGKPMAYIDASVGGRAVGVPGTVHMLALAHRQHGKLPWAQLFTPAIELATRGFRVSERMATLLSADQHLAKDPVAAGYFYDAQGKPWPAGHVLRNPELAAVLLAIANNGADALLTGELARTIVNKVQRHPANPGTLSLQDLQTYQALEREPLCFDYTAKARATTRPIGDLGSPHVGPHIGPQVSYRAGQGAGYRICGMPPPSSGVIAIGQILGMLSRTPADQLPLAQGLPSSDWLHLYTESARLAFADRDQFVADPDFVQPPAGRWASLLEAAYLARRAQRIDASPGANSMKTAPAGNPGTLLSRYAPMPAQAEYGTSQIAIVDRFGNALSMTTTIADDWGARQMVNRGLGLTGGFLLNNELTDFSFTPTGPDGKPVANRVEPGKRPRSSMSPTLVFDKQTGQLLMSLGSPGGAFIIHFTAKTLYGTLHWGLNTQQAINLPNFGSLNGPTLLEAKRFPASTVAELKARAHTVIEMPMASGLQAIERTATGYFGGADPRREGLVLGD